MTRCLDERNNQAINVCNMTGFLLSPVRATSVIRDASESKQTLSHQHSFIRFRFLPLSP